MYTGDGDRIGRALVSHAGDCGFKSMVKSNQLIFTAINVAHTNIYAENVGIISLSLNVILSISFNAVIKDYKQPMESYLLSIYSYTAISALIWIYLVISSLTSSFLFLTKKAL